MSVVLTRKFLAALAVLTFGVQNQPAEVYIPTSDAIRIAQMIARDEGYSIENHNVYWFDLIEGPDGKAFFSGYTTIGFYINTHIRSTISISEATGQAIDMNTCQIFNYPDLQPFQKQVQRLSGATKKSPNELAEDVGCTSPVVLTRPIKPTARKKPVKRKL